MSAAKRTPGALNADAVKRSIGALTKKEYLAKGKRGIAYTAFLDGKRVLVKEPNPAAGVNTIAHEAEMLQAANARKVGPLCIGIKDGALVREFVDGEKILDWLPGAQKQAIKRVLIDIVEQCRRLDEAGINKAEMNHPHKHVLVRNGKPVMIDFDRARRTTKPKNVTQACQWLTGGQLAPLLLGKSIVISREAVLAHCKSYKRGYARPAYERILEVLRNA